LCSRIYPALGKIEYLIPTILNEAVRAVTTCAPDTDPYSQFSEILVAVSAGTLLRGKLLARLRKVRPLTSVWIAADLYLSQAIARSSLKSYANLSLSPDWLEISTLVRFELALSFDSRVQAQLYLPDLCHIIVSVSGAGDYAARHAVRQLTANVVHSLTKDPSSEVNVGKLRSILETLTSTEGGDDLFEVSGGSSSRIGALPHERLVALLVEVIEAAAPSIGTSLLIRPITLD
jgi:neurofibromin 1